MDSNFEDHGWKAVFGPKDYRVYAPYQRERKLGQRPALLLIGLCNVAFARNDDKNREPMDDYPHFSGQAARDSIEPIKNLLSTARDRGLPVVHIALEHESPGEPDLAKPRFHHNGASGADDFAIKDEFQPLPGEPVLRKRRDSAFFDTALETFLTRLDVGSLILCGQSTSGAIRATAVSAKSYGYHSVIVEECVFDQAELLHNVALFDTAHKYADVMHLDDILERLSIVKD